MSKIIDQPGTSCRSQRPYRVNNPNRLGKTLWTQADPGEKITIFNATNEQEEARYLVDHINSNRQNNVKLAHQAILYRSNAQSRVIEEHLARAGISYIVYGGLRFFERAEIKDSIAYMRLIVNHHDNQAFERIVNVLPRAIGQASIDKFQTGCKNLQRIAVASHHPKR